jgi:hypothetical protein
MIRTAIIAITMFGLVAGAALAAPAPNEDGATGMGGGVYYNPWVAKDRARAAAAAHNQQDRAAATTQSDGASPNPS